MVFGNSRFSEVPIRENFRFSPLPRLNPEIVIRAFVSSFTFRMGAPLSHHPILSSANVTGERAVNPLRVNRTLHPLVGGLPF